MPKELGYPNSGCSNCIKLSSWRISYHSHIFKLLSQFFLFNAHSSCPEDDLSSLLLLLPLGIRPGIAAYGSKPRRLILALKFFSSFFYFFSPFFLLFLSYINTSSLLIFNLLIGGKLQLFFSIFGPDLVRLSGAITQESCSLSNPLLLMISTLTPQVPVAP